MKILGADAGGREVVELREALAECATAAESDSNDGEILALNQALDLALSRWPEISRSRAQSPPAVGQGQFWVEMTDAAGEEASARWGDVTDSQIDAALSAVRQVMGRDPDTTT